MEINEKIIVKGGFIFFVSLSSFDSIFLLFLSLYLSFVNLKTIGQSERQQEFEIPKNTY